MTAARDARDDYDYLTHLIWDTAAALDEIDRLRAENSDLRDRIKHGDG